MLNKACHHLPSDAAFRKSWIIATRRLPVRIRMDRVLCTLRTVGGLGSLCHPKIFEIFNAIVGCVR